MLNSHNSVACRNMSDKGRVEHRVPKKFLFFRCGTKLVREEYYSKNPHTVIEDVETVVIVDKKGKRKDR